MHHKRSLKYFFLFALVSIVYGNADSENIQRRSTSSAPAKTACAEASSASAAFASARPSAQVRIPADVAYDCLQSVPNHVDPAIRLISGLRSYLEFQSDLEYLENPPEGYLVPAANLEAELHRIRAKVENRSYVGEYEMQLDLMDSISSAHDGHLFWEGDLATGVFTFIRGTGDLASVSADGKELPQIYLLHDLLVWNSESGRMVPTTGFKPSPIEKIDGIGVVSFLLSQSSVSLTQDPDAMWNQNFYELGRRNIDSNFLSPGRSPGPSTTVTFKNGTSRSYSNWALVKANFDGVNTGEDAYDAFCPGASISGVRNITTPLALSKSQPASATESAPTSPTISGYPYPAIKHSLDAVAGYYLNGSKFQDCAILQIQSFGKGSTTRANFEQEFQHVVQEFFDAAVHLGKTKLILDLQGNPGGSVDLGIETFAQLFPSLSLNSQTNMRASLGLNIVGQIASANVSAAGSLPSQSSEDVAENHFHPFAYQTVMTPDSKLFPNFDSFYGPHEEHGGRFTSMFQDNYTDPNSSDFEGKGIIITGTNDRKGFRQPFIAQNIVVISDGFCASTCAVLFEYLKNHAGVQFIGIGGRPQIGPMQAVGGVKGAQKFPFNTYVARLVEVFWSSANTRLGEVKDTIWENFTYDPILRMTAGGLNGRNNFRVGEPTETPLQFVYEAADCRIWWTREMLSDPIFLWERVATIAFRERRNTQFNSKYCIMDSTGHPTSISGGWQKGTLGPQTPPDTAKSTKEGWIVESDAIGDTHPHTDDASTDGENTKLKAFKQACTAYDGNAWFVQVACQGLMG